MKHFVEFRSINLKPGMRDEFHRLYSEQFYPLPQRRHFDVMAYGPALHDENSYYVIRRFDSLSQREQMEDAFYGSALYYLDKFSLQFHFLSHSKRYSGEFASINDTIPLPAVQESAPGLVIIELQSV